MRSTKTKTTSTKETIETSPKKTTTKVTRTKKSTAKAKPVSIAEQIETFLQAGGEIQKIPSGVSGQPSLACRRSMTISEKAPEKSQVKQVKTA